MKEEKEIVHALIVPWSLSQDMMLWCGKKAQDRAMKNDHVATEPEKVNCEGCIRGMRGAYVELSEWVPRLKVG